MVTSLQSFGTQFIAMSPFKAKEKNAFGGQNYTYHPGRLHAAWSSAVRGLRQDAGCGEEIGVMGWPQRFLGKMNLENV